MKTSLFMLANRFVRENDLLLDSTTSILYIVRYNEMLDSFTVELAKSKGKIHRLSVFLISRRHIKVVRKADCSLLHKSS